MSKGKRNSKSRNGGFGRGTLLLVSALFFVSVALRMGTENGAALAKEIGEAIEAAPKSEMAETVTRDGVAKALEAIRAREAAIAEKELAFADRMQALTLAEARAEEKLEQMRLAEESLKATIQIADQAAENDLARLTAVYENMKPKDASALFTEMSPEFAVGFVGRMRPDAAAAILSGMPPDKAHAVSVLLASRNAGAPPSDGN